MAVPRPVLLALLGLGLLASVFLVTRSGSNESVTEASRAAEKPHAIIKSTVPKKARAATRVHRTTPKSALPGNPGAPAVPARHAGAPVPVADAARALESGKVVVLFFSRPGPADDTATRQSMQALDGMHGISVFKASLKDIAAYRPMLSGLGISQVPATVIVRSGRRAVLFQGFVDEGTLRQNVADALR